jgi:hypothetical protein
MATPSNRRKFIKHLGLGSLAATMSPTSLLATGEKTLAKENSEQFKDLATQHKYNDIYTGDYLNRVAFPIGGIGAGMFCLEGGGAYITYVYS